MIKVYFETKQHAEQIATFESEDIYLKCLPILEEWANKNRGIITENEENTK